MKFITVTPVGRDDLQRVNVAHIILYRFTTQQRTLLQLVDQHWLEVTESPDTIDTLIATAQP